MSFTQYELKSTGETVFGLNSTAGGKYVECLFQHGRVTKRGNRGHVQSVRASNLKEVRRGYSFEEKKDS